MAIFNSYFDITRGYQQIKFSISFEVWLQDSPVIQVSRLEIAPRAKKTPGSWNFRMKRCTDSSAQLGDAQFLPRGRVMMTLW